MFLRRGSSEWSDLSIGSDLDTRFEIESLDLALPNFSFFKHSFQCKNRLLKKSILLSYFCDSEKMKFFISVICDPQFFPWLTMS